MTPVEDVLFWIFVFLIFLFVVCVILGIFIFRKADEINDDDFEMATSLLMALLGAFMGTIFVLGLFSANGYTLGG